MIITISGMPGAGKTTLAKYLAKTYKLKHVYVGRLMREMAKKKELSLIELSKLAEKSDEVDKELDEMQLEMKKKYKDNIVFDSRIGFYFFPESIKILLIADPKVAARRIVKTKRKEEQADSISEAIKQIKRRMKSERKRYKRLYGIDIDRIENYDIVMDTTNLNIKQMCDIAKRLVDMYLETSKKKNQKNS